MLKNVYIRLALITLITVSCVLIVLPRIPITIKNRYMNIDSYIGGYYLALFDGKIAADLRNFRYGLDIQGGVRVVLQADMSKVAETDRQSALDAASQIISRRVNLLGVSEPSINSAISGDSYRIVVELPGLSDVTSAVQLIGQTAQLVFMQLPEGTEWNPQLFSQYYQDKSVWVDTGITGADLKGADVVFSQVTGADSSQPQIQLKFTNEGRQKFSDLVKKNVNKPIAIYLDQEPYPLSMPEVSPDLANGITDDPIINGSFDVASANALSVQLRAGALPVPVQVLHQEAIGATLGEESILRSFIAGLIGLILVFFFMVFMYGRLGLLSGIALCVYALLNLAVFKLVPVVITLPGIAGFILSIGMATDANILIFERIREELRWGKPKNLAEKLGFERAWNSIKDSNISSLITCAILFYLGSGSVRGFALTLAIGIFTSLFSAIFVVRTLMEIFTFSFTLPKFGWRKRK